MKYLKVYEDFNLDLNNIELLDRFLSINKPAIKDVLINNIYNKNNYKQLIILLNNIFNDFSVTNSLKYNILFLNNDTPKKVSTFINDVKFRMYDITSTLTEYDIIIYLKEDFFKNDVYKKTKDKDDLVEYICHKLFRIIGIMVKHKISQNIIDVLEDLKTILKTIDINYSECGLKMLSYTHDSIKYLIKYQNMTINNIEKIILFLNKSNSIEDIKNQKFYNTIRDNNIMNIFLNVIFGSNKQYSINDIPTDNFSNTKELYLFYLNDIINKYKNGEFPNYNKK